MPSTQSYLQVMYDYKYAKIIAAPFTINLESLEKTEGAVKFAWVFIDGRWEVEEEK